MEIYLQKLSKKIADKTFKTQDEKEVIFYGLKIFVQMIFYFLTTIIFSILFKLYLESIIFLCCYLILRTYAGGFHCQKRVNCYFVSCSIVALALATIKFMPIDFMVVASIFCIIVSAPIIIKYAPVEAINKPLEEIEKLRYRKITMLILATECLIVLISLILKFNIIALTISISIFFVGILLIIKQKPKERAKNYEN